jgi:hypothetical protein
METFGIDPLQVPKGNTAKIDPLTFEKILDLMTDKFKNEDDFIIDAHGNENGFLIPIIKGGHAMATSRNLATIQGIVELRAALKNAGDDLQKLQGIVRRMSQNNTPVSPGDPNNPAAVDKAVKENKQKIEDEISRLKKSIKFNDESAMARVVQKINELKKKQRNRIELRACNMGIFPGLMTFFRALFNAKILRAVKHFSAFGHFIPEPRSDASYKAFLKKHGKAIIYPVTGGNFAFEYIPKPDAKADIPSVATSDAAVKEWVKAHQGDAPNVKASKFPTHFLLKDPPAFQKDTNYKILIAESKA